MEDASTLPAAESSAHRATTTSNLPTSNSIQRHGCETGFGDFCLGRCSTKDEQSLPFPLSQHATYPTICTASNAAPMPEPDGFIRSTENFLFNDLPMEVRLAILKLVVAPFFVPDPLSGLELYNEAYIPHVPKNLQLTLSTFKHSVNGVRRWGFSPAESKAGYVPPHLQDEYIASPDFIPNEIARRQGLMGEGPAIRAWSKKNHVHPAREEKPYLLTKLPIVPEGDPQADHGMLELLRNMSNVSTGFRNLLGAVLWTDISLTCTHVEVLDGTLLHLFTARPGFKKAVKGLKMELHFDA